MTIKLSSYALNKPFVKWYYDHNKDNKDVCLIASELAIATHAPVVVMCYYLKELIGPCEELDKQIASLISFYKIQEIVE